MCLPTRHWPHYVVRPLRRPSGLGEGLPVFVSECQNGATAESDDDKFCKEGNDPEARPSSHLYRGRIGFLQALRGAPSAGVPCDLRGSPVQGLAGRGLPIRRQ